MAKIAIIVTARASWAKLEPICRALRARPDVELQIIACASALLERYGRVVDVIKSQGYTVTAEVWSTYEGATLETSAKETGALLCDLASVLRRLRPDMTLVCADRHEVLGAAQAVVYQHLRLAHIQGGERSGNIDDRVRDSVSQLADVHFPSTELAKHRVYSLTGQWERIYNYGCPSVDVAKESISQPAVTLEELGGAGASLDLSAPFVCVLQHPVTSEADRAYAQMLTTLEATRAWPRLVLWPGQDAGADGISKAIRSHASETPFHTVKNLPPARFLRLVTQAAVLVGNSSAGIRESSYLGVPVVNIGSRQHGRERGPNVVDVPYEAAAIRRAVFAQMAHGRYPSVTLYGSGTAGPQIAERLIDVCHRINSGSERVEGDPREELPTAGGFSDEYHRAGGWLCHQCGVRHRGGVVRCGAE